MSKQDYELLKEEIERIENENLGAPSMPVSIALQEAENLAVWCQSDLPLLYTAGLDKKYVDTFQARIGACRYCESIWQKENRVKEEAGIKWGKESPAAFDLRDELVHHCFHAFRWHDDLMGRVRDIDKGSSNADMIQDLSDLCQLGKSNKELLNKVGVDIKPFEEAGDLSGKLADLLAVVNGERTEHAESKRLRDKAFFYMQEAVKEIRHHGQYKFWRNPDRKKGYVSQYHKR